MIIQISPLGKHLPKAWGGCAEPYPQGSFGRNGQRPTQHWCPVRDGKSDALRWGVFAAPFFDAHRVQACYRSGDPLSAAQPSLQCGRDAAGLVVSDGAGSGANRDDSTAATERCLSVFDRAALLSGSLHDAPLSVASGPAGPVATAQAARPVLEPHAGSPPHTGALEFRLGIDRLCALPAARERSRRLQPEQAGASFLLPTAVFRSPDPRLLARRVAARRCGHAARRAGMRTGLLPQNPAEGPTRDFARRQRVFRSQADRLGGGARRRLCDRGPAHSAHPAPAERAALPSLGVGRRDCHVSLSAHGWTRLARFVVIRRPQPEDSSEQLRLFQLGRYHYQVLVTNLPLQPLNLWRFYNQRAAVELIIKQLKADYALGHIPTRHYMANETYFHLLLLAYNLMNWFKRLCLPPEYQAATLQSLRHKILLMPAQLRRTHNRPSLALPASGSRELAWKFALPKIIKLKASYNAFS